MWGSVKGPALVTAMMVAASTPSLLGCAHAPPSPQAPPTSPSRLLGNPSPSFRRPTVQGGEFDSGGTADRVLVVDFFAAYCQPCRRALPALEALHRRRPDLAVVGVSLDPAVTEARGLVARHRLTFPVVHDPTSALAGRFRVTELPASFVVDRSGRIAWVGDGDQPEDALARAAEMALAAPGLSRR
jgi:peroxiredoxin